MNFQSRFYVNSITRTAN